MISKQHHTMKIITYTLLGVNETHITIYKVGLKLGSKMGPQSPPMEFKIKSVTRSLIGQGKYDKKLSANGGQSWSQSSPRA